MAQKRNLRKIPAALLDKLTILAVDDIVVACAKRLTPADVANYAHLNLRLENGTLVVPHPAVPPVRMGKYSDANVNGREVVRRDLPMITKSIVIQVPNWGGYGTHDVWQSREVYARDFIAPKEVTLSVELLNQALDGSQFTVKFAVDQVLNRAAADFEGELLYNLNIMQENVGASDVFASEATLADYVATIRLDWEILPPGNVDEVLRRMLHGKRAVTAQQQQVMRQRIDVMSRLNPQNYIAGTNEFLRYFGAKFEDAFVAFENLNYGNALYVMFDDWEDLCRRSRVDLLKGARGGFERIPHAGDWEGKLKALLRQHRRDLARK
jgi:hypothetical protein